MQDNSTYLNGNIVEVISSSEIKARINIISADISSYYNEEIPILIGVLNGAFIFTSDIIRCLDIQCEVDFIKIKSYGNNLHSTGKIQLINDISLNVENRHVIIIEDIVDTGLSLRFLKNMFEQKKPKSLKYSTLLYKNKKSAVNFNIDWIGFNIEDKFHVGYGLDLNQLYRGLKSIYILNK